jgi:hypothetical protein
MRKINGSLKKIIKEIDKKIFFNLIRAIFVYFLNFKILFLLFFYNKKKKFFNISYYNYNNNSLTELCEIYKSDKGSINHNKKTIWGWTAHTYSNYYYSLFNHFKDDVKLVFECGLGTNNPDIQNNMTVHGMPGAPGIP